MINKKGIGVGQVFLFIIAAITFALILIFGYKTINGFLVSGEKVQFVQFKSDLQTSIKSIYTEFGAVRLEQFHLPPTFDQICFVDVDGDPTTALNQELQQLDPIAYNVWQEADGRAKAARAAGLDVTNYEYADQNVFFQPLSPVQIKVHKMSIQHTSDSQKDYLCPPVVNGVFSLRLEGKGDKTELSLPPAS